MVNGKNFIAQRALLYSLKGNLNRHPFLVRVGAPYLINDTAANVKLDEGSAGCAIEFEGEDVTSIEVHGIDLIHALSLAVDIDRHLRSMTTKYDFFWSSGEPYFEDA